MEKRIVNRLQEQSSEQQHSWLDLEGVAEVELTSEDAGHPVEGALLPSGGGWRAAEPGPQTIRLTFRSPQRVRRIRLRFDEPTTGRTQEFVLRWSPDGGRTFRHIVRQQYTFSPSGAKSEIEDLVVDLPSATALELHIIPDQHGHTYATLAEWRIS